MRNIFLVIFLLSKICLLGQNENRKKFILSGTLKNSNTSFIYLMYADENGSRIQDSSKVEDDSFHFTGVIKEPTLAILKCNSKPMEDAINPNITTLYLEPGIIEFSATYNQLRKATVLGSKTHDEQKILDKQIETVNKNSDSLFERYSKVSREYINSHLNSFISAQELASYKGRWPMDTVKSIYTKLSMVIQNSNKGKEIRTFIDEFDDNTVGKPAKNFQTNDINGKSLSLSKFKGNYVLLDFWGSWCVPCREGIPHLKELFKKYSEKGFVIIGVAQEYDKSLLPWREAIKNDGSNIWYNILSDLNKKDKNNATTTIVKSYGIHSFPTKILVDKQGIIIARLGNSEKEIEELDKILSELYK